MTRTGLKIAAMACGVALLAAVPASAYFPPPSGTITAVPPDPFVPPTAGGVGEPNTPDPTVTPTVSTPEPSSIITALTAVALLAGYGIRQRRLNQGVSEVV